MQVKKTEVPIFIVHGDSDMYNPTYMAYDLYDAAAGEKDIWIVSGANHGMAYYANPAEYAAKVKAFYDNYID